MRTLSRKPAELEQHPVPYAEARDAGCVRGVCKHVVDGDTFDVLLDLGFGSYSYVTLRLLGYNAPELKGESRERGLRAKTYAAECLKDKPVLVRSSKSAETFGRYVAEVTCFNGVERFNLREALLKKGDWSVPTDPLAKER